MSALSVLALLGVPAGFFALAGDALSASIWLALFMTIGSALSVLVTVLTTVVIPNEIRGFSMAAMMAGSLLFGLGVAPLCVSLLSDFMGGPTMIGRALTSVRARHCFTPAVAP